MQGPLVALLAVAFPIGFVLMWLAIGGLLGFISGWYGLMKRFPDRDEPPKLKLGGRSGFMRGVNLRGVLSLAACESGLRVSIWRGLGPFSKPFFVPWTDIAVERKRAILGELRKLRFGRPPVGALILDSKTWDRLSNWA